MAKVHVVGAGPAGCIAAISALRHGNDVVLSEEHTEAGIPENCSGLLSLEGLQSLHSFVDYRKCTINPVKGADIYFDNVKLEVRKKAPVGFVCSRTKMDQLLAEKAEAEGARINYGEKVKGRFHATNIIGADGPLSSVARHFSFNKIPRFASTLQTMTEYRCKDPHVVEVHLSNSRFPGFFGWAIPHDEERAELGVGVELPHRAKDAWEFLLKMKGIKNAPKPRGAAIPLDVRSCTGKRIGKRNIVLTGDAAGQVKSTTGGGVVFGGNCAALAGRNAADPLRYELEWRLKFGADLGLHSMVSSYLSSLSDKKMSSLGRRLRTMRVDEYLTKHGSMDRPTRMISPHMFIHSLKVVAGVK
jgi:geranylgeranyl reductase family protein